MPTVIHELADAFLRRKQALAERGQAKTKLVGSDYFMPKSAKQDLNNRLSVFEQGGLPELLKQAGKEMYDNPIVNTAIGFTPVLGDVQAAGETMAALNRGAPWQETAGYAAGMLPFVPMIGKTVWHGSPHSFEKFDLSKIGTGEGAQAYGHGLYLAESPETAKMYRDTLSKSDKQFYVKGNRVEPKMLDAFESNVLNAKGYGRNKQDYLDELEMNRVSPSAIQQMSKVWDEMGDVTVKEVLPENASLYKVDLPDEQIAKMLDWDKPLSQQAPEVRNALSGFGYDIDMGKKKAYEDALFEALTTEANVDLPKQPLDLSGEQMYRKLGNPQYASQRLYEAGIPGIQYLDQASRGAGEGTRNYVVFSDEIPKILERNGTSVFEFPKEQITQSLESVNPTGTIFTEYNPSPRATMPLGKNITTLDKTMEVNPSEYVTIYRGVPSGVKNISPGDFITTNQQLAKDYAGNGKVISKRVPASHILDDITEPLGEEYIYRP